uniref:fimbrial protein n=1 Tax=Castellaniella defragrans TaxID=75697 RepID=UPI003341BB88
MKLKALFFLAGLAPAFAFAAPTVTFQGEVSDQTCTATINGQTNSIVLLPTVPVSALSSAGQVAGLTPFTVHLSDCTAPTVAAQDINITFLGYAVTNGNLGNLAVNDPATNVQIQLTTTDEGTNAIQLNGVTAVSGLSLPIGETSTNFTFGAQYISVGGPATAGAVTAVAEYALEYL